MGTASDPRLSLRLLGPLDARLGGQPLARPRSRTSLRLLAFLVLRSGRPLDRGWLAETLWPDSTEQQAHYNLRRNLTDLRRLLGPESARLFAPGPRQLQLDAAGLDCDLLQFDEALARGGEEDLAAAVALYRGPLLEGWNDDWVLPERAAREERCLRALERLATAAADRCDHAAAAGHLRRILAADPARESAARALMTSLAELGDFGAVAQAYQRIRLYLHDRLRTQPTAETNTLFRTLSARAAFSGHSRHRASSSRPPRRLPRQRTRLVGREDDRRQVAEAIERWRLVTLTGQGGVGKTRLAIAVGEDVADTFPQGAWFVDLAPLADPAQVDRTVAEVLGIREESGRSVRETLCEALASRILLLVLDNCEHLVEACAVLADALLETCPGVRLLATSRQSLGVPGEHVWRLGPLPAPDEGLPEAGKDTVSRVMSYPSVRLFVERAQAVDARFALRPESVPAAAAICRRLDGIPLAIELAAAQTAAMTPAQIAERLDDRFRLLVSGSRTALPRQRTLQGALEWSFRLLSGEEQALLRRLAVFAGGWSLEAAEAVSGPDLAGGAARLLVQLVDKGLVSPGLHEDGRCRLLETVREFVMQQPDAARELQETAGRHARYYLELARQAWLAIQGPEQVAWLDRIDADHENFRAALRWLEAQPNGADDRLRMAAWLAPYWEVRGHMSEGRERLDSAIAAGRGVASPEALAAALVAAGRLAAQQGDYSAGSALGAEAVRGARQAGSLRLEADALAVWGASLMMEGLYGPAEAHLVAALAASRRAGYPECEARSLGNLGIARKNQRRFEEARRLLVQSAGIWREIGGREGEGAALHNLGTALREEGRWEDAERVLLSALQIHRETGNRRWQGISLFDLGMLAAMRADLHQARSLLEESLALAEEAGDRFSAANSLNLLGTVALEEGRLEEAAALQIRSLLLRARLPARRELAYSLSSVARVAAARGDARAALVLVHAAATLRRELGLVLARSEQEDEGQFAASLASRLPAATVAAAAQEGSAMTMDRAVDFAAALAPARATVPASSLSASLR